MKHSLFWNLIAAASLFCTAAAIASSAQDFTTLVRFNQTDGATPSNLIQGFDGSLYGTTQNGGKELSGTVFKTTRNGTLTRLYSFCSQRGCLDGWQPLGSLVQAVNGNFYGTTEAGGTNDVGVLFKMAPEGKPTVIHNFCSVESCADGEDPFGGLIQANNGKLYGTTETGGSTLGTLFEITPAGTFTTLYGFCSQMNCATGANPETTLVQAANGKLYGTAQFGGVSGGCLLGCGTFFEMTLSGELTALYSFCSQTNCSDGSFPGQLVLGADGNFYGTTSAGGTGSGVGCNGCGTVFKMTPAGELTTLYNFCSQPSCSDGFVPQSLIQATDGNFYGLTQLGGKAITNYVLGAGTIFKITPAGVMSTIYDFCTQSNCTDGSYPSYLMQATDGALYGTTSSGGEEGINSNLGTVFRLSTGISSFVRLVRDSGRVGQSGGILGYGLTGTTGVFLNGTPAPFTVRSDTYIQATVPTGATSGYVTVTAPTGTLTSNVAFQVIP